MCSTRDGGVAGWGSGVEGLHASGGGGGVSCLRVYCMCVCGGEEVVVQ